eukprot:14828352-Alexandrium_andersonii.AAC.1
MGGPPSSAFSESSAGATATNSASRCATVRASGHRLWRGSGGPGGGPEAWRQTMAQRGLGGVARAPLAVAGHAAERRRWPAR